MSFVLLKHICQIHLNRISPVYGSWKPLGCRGKQQKQYIYIYTIYIVFQKGLFSGSMLIFPGVERSKTRGEVKLPSYQHLRRGSMLCSADHLAWMRWYFRDMCAAAWSQKISARADALHPSCFLLIRTSCCKCPCFNTSPQNGLIDWHTRHCFIVEAYT